MNDSQRFLPTHSVFAAKRWESGRFVEREESVAEEIPAALIYNGLPHVVMMTSPSDLEEFALGFSLSEGILQNKSQMYSVAATPASGGIEIRMDIDLLRYLPLEEQRRNLAGRTGCGLCGAETFEQAIRHPAPVGAGPRLSADTVNAAFSSVAQYQTLNARTGAVHAAAWAAGDGTVQCVREDVGRHNALDKMIGAMTNREQDFARGFALITSRASFEMVQKAASVGIAVLAAISAPTALAIRLAQETGVTLIGFSRAGCFNVYANAQRINS
ncbi:MAG: formate dehydrogenase accessory sulfurtransferase FdhD [Betaproteobacteria bacterium]|nr:formate dehydrogenase accessory sulfurtransferase FdhD [Betaproteobacteria bacterium]